MEEPLVTVIIPVYNTEKYLIRCLDSMVKQSMSNIEVLLIDDGSSDNSVEICDRYAAKDSRFKLLQRKHEGVSAARNYGVEQSSAEYIMFVDSDDWVEPDFCEAAYQAIKEHDVDIVMFLYDYIDKEGELHKASIPGKDGDISKDIAMRIIDKECGISCWNKIYRKSLLVQFAFPNGRTYEDTGTMHKFINYSNGIFYITRYLYHYRFREGSISNTSFFSSDYYDMQFIHINDICSWGYADRDNEIAKYVDQYAIDYLLCVGLHAKCSKWCIDYLQEDSSAMKRLTPKCKIMYSILKVSPALFDWICVITRKRLKLIS